nr:MAG TPA: hypothetical protein [Caudoviricetes sp.]
MFLLEIGLELGKASREYSHHGIIALSEYFQLLT